MVCTSTYVLNWCGVPPSPLDTEGPDIYLPGAGGRCFQALCVGPQSVSSDEGLTKYDKRLSWCSNLQRSGSKHSAMKYTSTLYQAKTKKCLGNFYLTQFT